MWTDYGNAFFELVGAVFQVRNTIQIVRDRQVRGVYWPAWLFFTAWSFWNLYYYPSLSQWWSFTAGVVMAAANAVWVYLAWRYSKNG